MRRLFVTVGVCGLAIGIADASGPPVLTSAPTPKNSPLNIHAIVEQLGSSQFTEREAASATLEKIGPAAIDALRAAARSENPEIRDRAASLLTKLRRLADSETRLTAKRVALDYQDVPLGSAINDLKARTGLNVTLDPARVANPLRKITCRTGELPAWEALEAFCVAAALRESFPIELDVPKPNTPRRGYIPPPQAPSPEAIPVVLIDGASERLLGSRSGAVRVLVLPATFPGHRVTLGTGEMSLALDVTPMPGLGWQEVVGVKINKLIDSSGRAGGAGVEKNVLPMNDPNGVVVFARPGVAMRFDANGNSILPENLPNPRIVTVPLKLGTPSARSLKQLEGSIFGEIQVANQHLITVTNPAQNTNAVFEGPGDTRLTVLEFKEPPGPGGLGTIKVQLDYPSDFGLNVRRRGFNNMGWPEAPRMGGQANRVEAFDAAGKPFPMASNAFTNFSNDGTSISQTYTMTFRPGQGAPAKLVVVGSKQVTVEVPFVLENVPLP
ncbi:MAG: hypothetical protein C0467_15605 [Planctomycetaceae bacterium]|nr:hypothetical protein [Planctomycetaceae bacterium]